MQQMALFFFRMLLMSLLLSLGSAALHAQETPEPPPPPQVALVPYRCDFERGSNSALIHAVLMGSDGRPIPTANYAPVIAPISTGIPVPAEFVSTAIVPERPPLQLTLVLDLTDTVPLEQIINAVSNHLAPRLNPLDEVALLTFSSELSPRTQFYTDKIRLVNEHMLDLEVKGGDNRLYDALQESISEMPFNSDTRQVVLVVTDSNRRDTQQVSLETLSADALSARVQVYGIAFYTQDRPDEAELRTLSNRTGGYTWIYAERPNTRASIEAAVSGYLEDFVRALNSEILIRVDLRGQTPDITGRVSFTVAVDPANEAPVSAQVSCPVQQLNHSITFAGSLDNTIISQPVTIEVAPASDLDASLTKVVFFVNNEIVPNTNGTIFTFNTPDYQPGVYHVGAELRDIFEERLATTATTIRLVAQQQLDLSIVGENTGGLSGAVQFLAARSPDVQLPAANFTIAQADNPLVTYPLSGSPVPFQNDGRATLSVSDINTLVRGYWPDAANGERFLVRASVPSIGGDPDLAFSNELSIDLVFPAAAGAPVQLSEARISEAVPIGIAASLLVLNVLIFRTIGRTRIWRIIHTPDHHDLSPQLMALTVRREGLRQSFPLTKKTIKIGRGQSNDINLGDNPNISREHGVIMWRRGAWYYSNRKPLARTRINGKWRRGYIFHKLEIVTEMEIANSLLIFHSNAQQDFSDLVKTNL